MLKKSLKGLIVGSPLEPLVRAILRLTGRQLFTSSGKYWDERYQSGGNSGAGSYGPLAEFKAEVLNEFVARNKILSVIEFGSGDGNQLTLAKYPAYVGVDISETAVKACQNRFAADAEKSFVVLRDYDGQQAELSMSLDVIYHLIEDETFDAYMRTLFDAAERFAIIYSSNKDEPTKSSHVRHRKFTDWVATNRPGFELIQHIPNRHAFDPKDQHNTSFPDFLFSEKADWMPSLNATGGNQLAGGLTTGALVQSGK